jgi:alkanesulfonate monooxygenase SsuD/methylene tetrahydromethanopterin reductase-like flavin-dependent oxidoreductase (luciferase family)
LHNATRPRPKHDHQKPAAKAKTAALGFLAAVTERIGLSSSILTAPQWQTGLIAKQAAEVDVLSGGRLRLGIGLGWNHVEYEALDAEWKTRGARQAEQVEVLRRLWSQDLVSFTGGCHRSL